MANLLIQGGTVLDGSGKARVVADVRVRGNRITEIGTLEPMGRERVLDAKGMFVTPGFVDIHCRSDAYATLFTIPTQDSLVRQGVTTIVIGNSGSSLAPLLRANQLASIQKWSDITAFSVNWRSVAEFFEEVARHPLGVNVATLVGHGMVRRGILGNEERPLTQEELEKLLFMLEQGMEEGALGVSLGLSYAHARGATTEELSAIMELVREKKGLLAASLRDEAKGFLDSFKELYTLAKDTQVNMEFSHLKVQGEPFWNNYEGALSMLADESVPDVHFDIYPYATTSSVLYSFFPAWASEGGNAGLIATMRDENTRAKLIKELETSPYDFGSMVVSMGMLPASHIGQSIGALAKRQGIEVPEMALQLIEASHNQVVVLVKAMSKDNTRRAMQHPRGFVTTSAAGFTARHHSGMPHPRSFGAFARFLRLCREDAILPWEEAVHKITLGPASKVGLVQRGKIAEDWFADIAIWDPETIADKATFEDPYHYPVGVKYGIVNGELAFTPEEEDIVCAGKPIKKQ